LLGTAQAPAGRHTDIHSNIQRDRQRHTRAYTHIQTYIVRHTDSYRQTIRLTQESNIARKGTGTCRQRYRQTDTQTDRLVYKVTDNNQ